MFKIKRDGQFKARLVVRGFQQGNDNYNHLYDIYAPVARLSISRFFIVIATKLGLPIYQMGV